MDINRNNYEEYFLLYADDELSKAERKVVEVFVKENPEFREEFCMLKLTINIPDDEIKLEDKSFLFKNESSFIINKNNCEEVFVNYHDNELSEKEKLETENFLAQHPGLKSEFELIGKAKLSPETSIVYPGKKELYRKEKSGKVIPMVWRKYIAAAVLIGFGLWISVPYFTNQSIKTPAVAQTNPVKKSEPLTKNIIPEKPKEGKSQIASSSIKEKENNFSREEKRSSKAITKQQLKSDNQIVKNERKIKNPSYKVMLEKLNSKEAVQTIAINAPVQKITETTENYKNSIVENEAKVATEKIGPETKNNYAKTVSYTNISPVDNDNYVFYDVPAREFRKTKVGGFLKKVRRIVERTNPITRLLEGTNAPDIAKNF